MKRRIWVVLRSRSTVARVSCSSAMANLEDDREGSRESLEEVEMEEEAKEVRGELDEPRGVEGAMFFFTSPVPQRADLVVSIVRPPGLRRLTDTFRIKETGLAEGRSIDSNVGSVGSGLVIGGGLDRLRSRLEAPARRLSFLTKPEKPREFGRGTGARVVGEETKVLRGRMSLLGTLVEQISGSNEEIE